MKRTPVQEKRPPDATEAWILGSGTAALASAFYLIRDAKIPPLKVHLLNPHKSFQRALHDKGDSHRGYDQFVRCLPVPVGAPLEKLLSLVPGGRAHFVHDEIEAEDGHRDTTKHGRDTYVLIQSSQTLTEVPIKASSLDFRHRIRLLCLMLKNERYLWKGQIRNYFPESFFKSAFWAIWSVQFGFQPWHSALEFRRALQQYLGHNPSLDILNCLDITGCYQHETIFLPLYFYLRSLRLDFQFDTKVKDFVMSSEHSGKIVGLDLVRNGLGQHQRLGPNDIVLLNVGSTVSGSTIGNFDFPPPRQSMEADEGLDENWSIWLNLRSKFDRCGNPYRFCTRQFESILESFTVTTRNLELFEQLCLLSHSSTKARRFIIIQDSRWKLNICIPLQPVFSEQPEDVRVLWGFSNSPMLKGDHVNKPMVQCSGAEILTEVLKHLRLDVDLRDTILIPRLMPRMSATLLSRTRGDRPEVIPSDESNIGFVGSFVEISQYSAVDISYEVRSAQKAVSQLMGLGLDRIDGYKLPLSVIRKVLFSK